MTAAECCADDDDEWTEVGTSQLLQPTDTQAPVTQLGRDTIEPSDDTHTLPVSLNPAAAALSSSSSCQQAVDQSSIAAAAAAAESHGNDVTQSSTDHDSLSSSQTKNDGLVVVSVTPERTSPSDDSSNAKGLLLSSSPT